MQLEDSAEHRRFRGELAEFLESWRASFGDDAQRAAFWKQALERGYLYRGIPRAYGGSEQPIDLMKDRILAQDLAAAGVGQPPCDARGTMIAHTLLDHGNEEQRERFLPATLRGEIRWCQGYSEPGAGSDLASLRSTARLESDHFVVNGQKVWTSGAAESDYMFGLFRSEPEARKNAGISYLLVDMKSPGVRVAPMKQIDGGMDFNEVFLDDVRVPAQNLVGARGQGWQVSRATLKYERGIIGGAGMMQDRFAALLELARRTPRGGRPAIEDPEIRQSLASIESRVLCADYSGLRMLSGEASGAMGPVLPLMLGAKLYATDTYHAIAQLVLELIGDGLMVAPSDADVAYEGDPGDPGYWVHQTFVALNISIGGGSSNIQRNIVGEKILGLPRDPRYDAPKT
jgi:alkylation response protein AidB-like acyl-CoA dehydrogenase